jgi:hypothetical protein
MKLKLFAALAALPLAAAANAGNVYSACEYEDGNTGKRPFTQLFTLKGDALRDSYGQWTYEKNLEWEAGNPVDKYTTVRPVSGFYPSSLVGRSPGIAACWPTGATTSSPSRIGARQRTPSSPQSSGRRTKDFPGQYRAKPSRNIRDVSPSRCAAGWPILAQSRIHCPDSLACLRDRA